MTNQQTTNDEEAPPAEDAQETEPPTTAEQVSLVPVATKAEIAALYAWGKVYKQSGFFRDARSEAQAAVKILMGRALGFDMISSMTGLHIVEGRPTLGANLMAHAVKRSGKYTYRVMEHDDDHCVLHFYEKMGSTGDPEKDWALIGESTFTIADAERAGLLKKGGNWEKWPRNMVFARALSNGVRWHTPDVFSGTAVYTPEELRPDLDITEDGEPRYVDSIVVDNNPTSDADDQPARPQGEVQPDRDRSAPRQGGSARAAGGRGQQGAQAATRASAARAERVKFGKDDWSKVADVQSLMMYSYEAFQKVQADVNTVLKVPGIPEISASRKSPADYREAALELLRAWDPKRYEAAMEAEIGPLDPDAPTVDVDAESASDEKAQVEYETEQAGPDEAEGSTVEVQEDGTIIVDGEPAEPYQ